MFPFPMSGPPGPTSAILKPQDVFATSLYTGNSSGQKISLPFSPDFVWIKPRNTTNQHFLFDKLRGSRNYLSSNLTDAEVLATSGFSLVSFDADGFTLGQNYNGENGSGTNEVAWPMKRAAKFFDIVTWTGDGTSNRQIPHSLGVPPGMVIARATSSASNWHTTHRGLSNPLTGRLFLETTGVETAPSANVFPSAATASALTVGPSLNGSGATHVAYLFAHDPSADGIVQCGSFTEQSGGTTVTLGWQPQFILFKTPNLSGNWYILDTTRGWSIANLRIMYPDRPDSELAYSGTDYTKTTSTGFTFGTSTFFGAGTNVIYLAIRAPY